MTSTITDRLKDEGKLAVPSLGAFQVKEHVARTGHKLRTGETVEISAKRIPDFKPAKAPKDAVE